MPPSLAPFIAEGRQAASRYGLAAPHRSPQGTAGSQLGRLAGESMEFMDHREYQPGDDLRRLDWAAYARSDKMTIKLYRHEVSPHLDLVVDGSRSMALPGTEKARATAALAAAVLTAADNSGYTRRAYLTGRGCRPIMVDQSPEAWHDWTLDAAESPAESFRSGPPAWRRWGMRVVLSDLLWLGDPLELLLAMAASASAVYVIQILAADDVSPPHRGNHRLVDSETENAEELFLDAAAIARYRGGFQRHCDNWQQAARQIGAVLVPLIADDVCRDWNLSPLVEAGILTL
jgi:uncharacterized protein (DUF58 family)